MKVLDLFSGIGGFSLGLEHTGGFKTVAFCEVDPKARLVLAKHWPEVPIYSDVKLLNKENLDADGITIDVITGGFPCQDISTAGKGAGLEGERSGLWFQFHRLIKEIKPRYAIIENVSALRSRGLDTVLRGLTEIGYDAEWHCIPASALGAPHRRDRIWILAYPQIMQQYGGYFDTKIGGTSIQEFRDGSGSNIVADTTSIRLQGSGQSIQSIYPTQIINWKTIEFIYGSVSNIWSTEPNVGRVANGVPNRVDRLKQLGNAVVPQIPQLIGEAILKAEKTCL